MVRLSDPVQDQRDAPKGRKAGENMVIYGQGRRLELAVSAAISDKSWGSRFVIPPHLGTWTALVGLGALEASAVGCGV